MKCKAILMGVVISASAVLGDYCNVKDRFIEPAVYKNVKVDSEGYPEPFRLQKKYQINKDGNLEVYIGNSNEWCKVGKDLRVNERSFSEMLKDESMGFKPYINEKVNDLIGWYERSFKNGARN